MLYWLLYSCTHSSDSGSATHVSMVHYNRVIRKGKGSQEGQATFDPSTGHSLPSCSRPSGCWDHQGGCATPGAVSHARWRGHRTKTG